MGEVYKACDTRLDRTVAIKVSQQQFNERFEREARAVASLNHANICQLYDLGALPDGSSYLVMEYVEGAPIAPVESPRKLLDYAMQMAGGMAAAHAAGFVHRDLKPDNVLITGPQSTNPGQVKILDFGLAKRATAGAQSEATQTIALGSTNPGTVLGTVAYMSPEQARGTEVDARSDQFSFGLILYELAAHKRAFVRPSPAETMAAIIRDEPDPLPSSVLAPLRWVVERCLAKDPAERYDSTRDLYRELKLARERLSESSLTASGQHGAQTAVAAAPRPRGLSWLPWGIAALAVAGLAVALLWPVSALEPPVLKPLATEFELQFMPRWSAAEDRLAYAAAIDGIFQIFIRKPDAASPTQVTHEPASCSSPMWSGDGSRIYFLEGLPPAVSLRSVAVAGGPSLLVRENVATADLTRDGKTAVMAMTGSTGKLGIAVATPPEAEPHFLPAENVPSLYFAGIGPGADFHVDPEGRFIGVLGADLSVAKIPLSGAANPYRSRRVDLDDFALLPDERHILGLRYSTVSDSQLSIVDTTTGAARRIYFAANQNVPAITADGKSLALPLMERGYDLVEVPLDGSPIRDVVSTPRNEVAPSWLPDGSRFAYSTDRSGSDQLWVRSRTPGLEQLLATAKDFPASTYPNFLDSAVSPDGTHIAYRVEDGGGMGGTAIWISPLSGDTPVKLWDDKKQSQRGPSWSPDGAWIAFYGVVNDRNVISKARVGGNTPPEVLAETSEPQPVRWSPDGLWIAYRDHTTLRLVSPDGKQKRTVSEHKWETYGWSKDGSALYGIFIDQNHHQFLSHIDIATARETKVADYGLTGGSVDFAYLLSDFPYRGFSLHPDGKSFLTSLYRAKSQIFLVRDFDRPLRLIDRLWKK
jgi:eukaryotic-like serine/threonine-protein kinase